MARFFNPRELIRNTIVVAAMLATEGCSSFEHIPTEEECRGRNEFIVRLYYLEAEKAIRENPLKDITHKKIEFGKNHFKLLLFSKVDGRYELISCKIIPYPQWDDSMNDFNYDPATTSIAQFYSNPSIDPNCKMN